MKRLFAAMLVGTAVLATPAAAQDDHGKVQVKLLGTAVLPDGKITAVNVDTVGLPAGTQTEANDNVVPTLAIEYFLSDSFSVETICCMTEHDVDAVSGLPGAELVADAKLIPATRFRICCRVRGRRSGCCDYSAGSDRNRPVGRIRLRAAGRHECAAERQGFRPYARCEEVLRRDHCPVVRGQYPRD